MAALVLLFATSQETHAFGRGGFFRQVRPHRPAPSYYETYHYMNRYYAKYYGGFHARYFQNMGIPSGDIGLRRNGILRKPW
jgi:hypothetical protein